MSSLDANLDENTAISYKLLYPKIGELLPYSVLTKPKKNLLAIPFTHTLEYKCFEKFSKNV
jgi:hypothetical protein